VRLLLSLFCYSFLLISLISPALAEQERPKTVAPIALIEQQKKDLQHYIDSEQVKPLLAGTDSYLTIIKKHSSVNGKGVAILLPDWQQGATNPKAINFLRDALPAEGWTTIAVQPNNKPQSYPSTALKREEQVEENQKIITEYQNKQKVMFNALMDLTNEYPGIVIVIAQGNNGALLASLFAEQNSGSANEAATNIEIKIPNAMVLLSSYRQTSNELINSVNEKFAKQLALSELPILDLYLQHDHPLVMAKVAQRKSLAKQEMKVYYRQRQLNNNATGYYPEQELLSQINSWLKSIGW